LCLYFFKFVYKNQKKYVTNSLSQKHFQRYFRTNTDFSLFLVMPKSFFRNKAKRSGQYRKLMEVLLFANCSNIANLQYHLKSWVFFVLSFKFQYSTSVRTHYKDSKLKQHETIVFTSFQLEIYLVCYMNKILSWKLRKDAQRIFLFSKVEDSWRNSHWRCSAKIGVFQTSCFTNYLAEFVLQISEKYL